MTTSTAMMTEYSYITIIPTKKTHTAEKTVWNNLYVADEAMHPEYFESSCKAWLKMYPEENFQGLEKFLRDHNFNTHLYARKSTREFAFPNDSVKLTDVQYKVVFICRASDKAHLDVVRKAKTYETNFERLATCAFGLPRPRKPDADDRPRYPFWRKEKPPKIITYEKEMAPKIINNEVWFQSEKVNMNSYLHRLTQLLVDKHGEKVKLTLVTLDSTGAPIYAFVCYGQILSSNGVVVSYTIDGPIVQLTRLQLGY